MDSTSRNLYNPHNKLVRPASMKVDYFSQKLQVGVEMNRAKSAKLLVRYVSKKVVYFFKNYRLQLK